MTCKPKFMLDGKEVEKITAFLFHAGGNEDPKPLAANAGKSFQGVKVYGQGFLFDDNDPESTSISEMNRLIEKDSMNSERIFPYIGGEEVNNNPNYAHHRYAINFGEMSEEEAWKYPALMKIVEEKVKPYRMANNREGYKRYWWQHGEKRPGLFRAIAPLDRVLVTACGASKYHSITFLSSEMVFSHALAVFGCDLYLI